MWIFLNDAFFSIIDAGAAKQDDAPMGSKLQIKPRLHADNLLVRARAKGDIERVFPGYQAKVTPDSDYRFRVEIPRTVVVEIIAGRLEDIDYGNFKDSVRKTDKGRRAAYGNVWSAMYDWQDAEEADRRKRAFEREEERKKQRKYEGMKAALTVVSAEEYEAFVAGLCQRGIHYTVSELHGEMEWRKDLLADDGTLLAQHHGCSFDDQDLDGVTYRIRK
ncbi:hypothetical protein [Vineibacter terrae]|uniref:hypothetical protein n=1 Tax=Vineibacter terrae TaxID=2586908 RepID=UPI0015B3C905|nr:hypothetical protein [Vineibacter terrae]